MRNDHYPEGSVRQLLQTDEVTQHTKQVLGDRLNREPVVTARYFTKENFQTLRAVCKRLVPQPSRDNLVDLPGLMEDQLIANTGNGWRYAAMPQDNLAIVSGLAGIEETAQLLFKKPFVILAVSDQDEVLHSLQQGTSTAPAFKHMSSALFFEEILTRLVEIYYSHPIAKEEIGDTSFADAKGWSKLGLNNLEDYEILSKKTSS